MNIKPIHPNFQMPTRSSKLAGGFDLFMPEAGRVFTGDAFGCLFGLGFAAEVPYGHVALLLPRSGVGAKNGLALNNTCGVIDSDYRGEWKASLRVHNCLSFEWEAGDRLLQMLIVPVYMPNFCEVDELSETTRGEGGFGSTGKAGA